VKNILQLGEDDLLYLGLQFVDSGCCCIRDGYVLLVNSQRVLEIIWFVMFRMEVGSGLVFI